MPGRLEIAAPALAPCLGRPHRDLSQFLTWNAAQFSYALSTLPRAKLPRLNRLFARIICFTALFIGKPVPTFPKAL